MYRKASKRKGIQKLAGIMVKNEKDQEQFEKTH